MMTDSEKVVLQQVVQEVVGFWALTSEIAEGHPIKGKARQHLAERHCTLLLKFIPDVLISLQRRSRFNTKSIESGRTYGAYPDRGALGVARMCAWHGGSYETDLCIQVVRDLESRIKVSCADLNTDSATCTLLAGGFRKAMRQVAGVDVSPEFVRRALTGRERAARFRQKRKALEKASA